MSLTKKIVFSVVPTFLATTFVSLNIYRNAAHKDQEFERAMNMVEYVNLEELAMVRMSEALRGYLLDPTNTREFDRKKAADEEYGSYAEKLGTLLFDDAEALALNEKMAKYDETDLDRVENEVAELIQKRDPRANEYYATKYMEARKYQNENFNQLKEKVKARSMAILTQYDAKRLRNAIEEIVLLGFSILFGIGCTLWITTTNLRRARALFQTMYAISADVDASAGKLSQSSSSLSESVNEQAAAIQETAASLDQVTAMIKKNAENASQSQTVSKDSKAVAFEGKASVDEMNRSMNEITESNAAIMNQVEAGNRDISQIVKLIGDIAEKTKVINDIVFQTKLLSFNASVEAARAGEHGKGFAVVADEVGKLASMSGSAAKEISDKLQESTESVGSIIQRTKSQVEAQVRSGKLKVERGAEISRACGELLDKISHGVNEVDRMLSEITLASDEQSKGINEINQAISQLDQTTQGNNQVAQASSAQAASLSRESTRLRETVDELYSLFNGRDAVSANDGARETAGSGVRQAEPGVRSDPDERRRAA